MSSALHCRKLRNLIVVSHSPLANPVGRKGPFSYRGLAGAGTKGPGPEGVRGGMDRLLAELQDPGPSSLSLCPDLSILPALTPFL